MANPYRVPKSKVASFADFEGAVRQYADDMTMWRRHMTKAAVDPAYHPYPGPQAHPEVVAAVALKEGSEEETYVPNFEIVDDGPTPDQILRTKKDLKIAYVTRLEREAIELILPIGKRRHFDFREQAILQEDGKRKSKIFDAEAKRRASVMKKVTDVRGRRKGALAALKRAVLGDPDAVDELEAASREIASVTESDLEAEAEKNRPNDDTEFLVAQRERRRKILAIAAHAAQLHHDIEDLTLETIDAWKPTPFPQEGSP